MDGFKGRLAESIQLRLAFWISLSILALAIVAGAFSFWNAYDEANELQDDLLRQIGALAQQRQFQPPFELGDGLANDNDSSEESRVLVQRYKDGETVSPDSDSLLIPPNTPEGIHTVITAGKSYRVLIRPLHSGEKILVAQETSVRDEVAKDGALRTVMPLLILLPIILVVISMLIKGAFKPIATLAAEVDSRRNQDLHPMKQQDVPKEIRPFVIAINQLLARVDQSMEEQRRFVADASHELRTPLTALSLQAESLASSEMSPIAQDKLRALRDGIKRSRILVTQLLSLSKAQANTDLPKTSLSIMDLFRDALEDVMPLAEAKDINLGIVSNAELNVHANAFAMQAILKNLLDNAIRYSLHSGRIDLSAVRHDQQIIVQVSDYGPGIPSTERERVFDPFYRILGTEQVGSGLGLSIVKSLAEKMNATITLSYTDEVNQTGLTVKISLPAA